MNALLISDLHLTAQPRDEYRWRLFDWLIETMPLHDVKELFILGDLTDAKDFHSARLVNRIVEVLHKVYRDGRLLTIWILRGNHDGIDPLCAYFRFLGKFPWVQYIETPYQKPFDARGTEVLMLPHTVDPVQAWQGVELHSAEFIFMHATVRGAVAENGMALDGIPPALLTSARRARIFSGDIHVPQKVGRVEYVGAPYPVRFGDKFQGRALLIKDWKEVVSLSIPSIQRITVTVDAMGMPDPIKAKLKKGDQVKVRVRLAPHEYGDWQRVKSDVAAVTEAMGVELCGIELERVQAKPLAVLPKRQVQSWDAKTVLTDYCKANKLDQDLAATGQALLEEP